MKFKNWQDIAISSEGVAPIFAKESVFKYHMSKKGKEVCNTQHFNEIFFASLKIENSVKFKNRQDIPSGGVAPIVARESVFKYHMSKKEKEVCNT